MQQIGPSESQIFEPDQNQFLSDYLNYESCPFCSRSFFRGKLAYHLKHCSSQNPMTKNNKNSSRHTKNSLSAATNYERCENCNCRIPSFLLSKHSQFCGKSDQTITKRANQNKLQVKDSHDCPEQTIFPKIKNYVSQCHTKTQKKISNKSNSPQVIKIRQQLRCLKIAEQVQKIQCQFCGRKFSEKAAERHIPICNILKQKQRRQIVHSKDSKNFNNKKQKAKLEALGRRYELVANKTFGINKKMLQSQFKQKTVREDADVGVSNENSFKNQNKNEQIKIEQK